VSGKVRVGIIGTSWWTEMMYLPSLRSHAGAEIAAICGRDRGRAEELAKANSIPRVFTDHRGLIGSGDVDAVVVATPDDLHLPMTMDALDAGLHVLCEKPIANNADDGRRMEQKARAAGVKNMVLFTWRWQPHWKHLKRLVEDGYIGRCRQARFAFDGGMARHQDYTWRIDGARSNGMVGDLGSHMIDLARWFLGDVRSVSAHLPALVDRSSQSRPPTVPASDSALLTMEMDSGAQVLVQAGGVSHVGNQVVRIAVQLYGDAGSIEAKHVLLGPDAGVVVRGIRSTQDEFEPIEIPGATIPGSGADGLMRPYVEQSAGPRLFIDSIITDEAVRPDFHDAVRVQEVVDAALRSHRERRWVDVG
jgi:predicted dehydrogenase